MVLYQRHSEHDPDSQYLKNIKINVNNFDGRHDSQNFLNWTQLDKYFTWYDLTEPKKVKFVAMTLLIRLVSFGPT